MMLTHDQLIFVLGKRYPQLSHGQDFLVGHPLDPVTKQQSGNPFILAWSASVARPDEAALMASYPEYEPEWLAQQAREQRDYLLRQSDWTQASDAPLPNAGAWKTYRQALRDVPQQPGFPQTINWPVAPA